jgi:hypothetical protein
MKSKRLHESIIANRVTPYARPNLSGKSLIDRY